MNPFIPLYHAHHRQHMQDLLFWQDLAAKQDGPILELGCGSGRISIPLARSGWQVLGLDQDAEMLRFLRSMLAESPSRDVLVFQANMAAFHLAQRFALILVPCNTFSTLDKIQRLATLQRCREHLRSDGLFAVSLPNPWLLRNLPRHSPPELEESFLHPLDGEPVQVSSQWSRTTDRFILTWHYDHLLPDGRVVRVSASAAHWLVTYEDYLTEFQSAGLRVIETYGDFTGSAYNHQSEALIILAALPGF